MPSIPRRKLNPEPQAVDIAQQPSPAAPISPPPSAEEIYQLIRETAYFKAEARHFSPGVELQDWLDAEDEVCKRLRITLP
jgi:Protein of unknown function (DUF2934)